MPDSHKNFAVSLVAVAPITATAGTALTVTTGEGTKFPTPPFNATIWPAGANPLTTNAEVVRVTAIVTDVLTIVRAQESSSARTVIVGDQIAATITAKTLTDAEAPAESQLSFTDITTNDVSTTKHGFAPKGSANVFDFLNGIGAYSQPIDYSIRINNLLGGTLKAQSYPFFMVSGNTGLTSQSLKVFAVYLPNAATITGVKWFQATAGSYTANNYNGIGLYSYSAGTLTLVASSTTDGNIWTQTSGTVGTKAFSSTYVAAAGVYFIAYLYCSSAQTTQPLIGVSTNMGSGGVATLDHTNSAKISGTLASQTALPSPTQVMSGLTSNASNVWGALY